MSRLQAKYMNSIHCPIAVREPRSAIVLHYKFNIQQTFFKIASRWFLKLCYEHMTRLWPFMYSSDVFCGPFFNHLGSSQNRNICYNNNIIIITSM